MGHSVPSCTLKHSGALWSTFGALWSTLELYRATKNICNICHLEFACQCHRATDMEALESTQKPSGVLRTCPWDIMGHGIDIMGHVSHYSTFSHFLADNRSKMDLGPIGVNWDKFQKWYQSIHLVSRITNLPHIPCVPLCCPTMEFVCIHGNKVGQHVPWCITQLNTSSEGQNYY